MLVKTFILSICFIKIICQNIIGFYQKYDVSSGEYSWVACHDTCYTCIEGYNDSDGNQNCLSCDPNKGRYFLEGDDKQNCYTEDELNEKKPIFLDKKQSPYKWVRCHPNCGSCSKRPIYDNSNNLNILTIQMNCDTCKNDFIKVNTFCYEKAAPESDKIGFKISVSITKYCGDFKDDRTGKQLGIFENGAECIIKPDNSYFINNDTNNNLKYCPKKCEICEGISGDPDYKCIKCSNNFVMTSNGCECPPIFGKVGDFCVNCKYFPPKIFNLNGLFFLS
jgi:hypothetical protein